MRMKHVELNDRGQVTLPAEVREYLGLVKDEELEVEIGSGGIVLLRTEPRRLTGEETARITRVKELLAKREDQAVALPGAEKEKLAECLDWMLTFDLEDRLEGCREAQQDDWLEHWLAPLTPEGQEPPPKYRLPGEAQPEGRSVVTLSPRGQVTLPMKQRRAADLREGDRFTVEVGGGMVVLVPKERRLNAQEQEVQDRATARGYQERTVAPDDMVAESHYRWRMATRLDRMD